MSEECISTILYYSISITIELGKDKFLKLESRYKGEPRLVYFGQESRDKKVYSSQFCND